MKATLQLHRMVRSALPTALMLASASLGSYGAAHASTIYDFTGFSDGANPNSLVLYKSALYGTAFRGGTGTCSDGGVLGCGTVFKLTSSKGTWHETVLHTFTQPSTLGAYPEGPLTFDAENAIYGTAGGGIPACGFYGCGVVFKLTPNGGGGYTESVLYSFPGSRTNGYSPSSGVIFGNDGALYGTTALGGVPGAGFGTVFRLGGPSVLGGTWSYELLYTFTNGADGAYPNGLILGANGALYGTTTTSVFELDPPPSSGGSWSFHVLYRFPGGTSTDGYYAEGGVVFGIGGALYGSTADGGTMDGGTIYQLSPPAAGSSTWTEKVLYSFPLFSNPTGNLALGANGALIGVTLSGGVTCDVVNDTCGSVFSLQPPAVQGAAWTYQTIHNFTGMNGDGAIPEAGVALSINGQIFGTTIEGGTGTATCTSDPIPGCGTVFMFKP